MTRAIIAGLFCLAAIICFSLAWMTRDAMSRLPVENTEQKTTIVDLSPWQTAQSLAALAVTAEEVEYAHEAERLADHEVDQAFASALRQAETPRKPKTDKAKALAQRVDDLQAEVKQDQDRVTALTKTPKESASASMENDLDLAKAQLGLDSDELNDAQQDLAREEGDQRTKIKQELDAHEANMRQYDSQVAKQGQLAVASEHKYGSVAARFGAWLDQRSRNSLLLRAARQSQDQVARLTTEHNRMEANRMQVKGDDKASRMASMKSKAAHTQVLSIFDDRIQTEQQLAVTYNKWASQVQRQHRIVQHLLLQSLGLIAFILFTLTILDTLARRLMDRKSLDARRTHTLGIIFKVSFQFAALLSILFVIFGLPSQMPAILGLTTAGLTVVLQDFIVAFFGWFVLIGKNGMRVGDWVEINGVGGEVIEIGLFRTALLETGNWTDKGHPTGRRVTFINSFAIRGQYFNFSTGGQWLWDEITVTIPNSDDTYVTIEAIHKAVLKETADESRLAEEEWKRVTKQQGVGQFSATPAVDMRPAANGIDIVVRYVTRAFERFEMRNRLYARVIELMHKTLPSGTPTLK